MAHIFFDKGIRSPVMMPSPISGFINRKTIRVFIIFVLGFLLVLLDMIFINGGQKIGSGIPFFSTSRSNAISTSTSLSVRGAEPEERLAFIGIFTLPHKVSRRAMIRETYLRFKPKNIRFVFVFGQLKTSAERTLVAFENATYGDLMVLDCPENMNEGKTWYFIRKVADLYGSSSPYQFVFKADDDAFLHLPNLERRLQTLPKKSTYFGRIWDRRDIMAGMLYGFSWDLIKYIAYDPEIVTKDKNGDEDQVAGAWIKGKVENMISDDAEFYDEPLSQAGWAHDYTPGTIVVHQLKRPDWFLRANFYFFGAKLQAGSPFAKPLLEAVRDVESREENWSVQ